MFVMSASLIALAAIGCYQALWTLAGVVFLIAHEWKCPFGRRK
jgi:hypothetical protein